MNQPLHGLMRFSKMHGAGNDFVVIDLRAPDSVAPDPALCRALADRHTGVGCDQILTIEPPRTAGAAASYRIWNADGSLAGQCGNGARCVAAWMMRDSAERDPERCLAGRFELDSPAGTHAVEVIDLHHYRLDMGRPAFEPARIPLHGFEVAHDAYTLEIDGTPVAFGAVSMGNPHAVIDIGDIGVDDIAAAPVATLGRDRVRLRVHERGVGETLACGSGACAAAAVLMLRGRVDREVAIELPGGTLRIAWPDDDATLTMAGPAMFVFEGEWRT